MMEQGNYWFVVSTSGSVYLLGPKCAVSVLAGKVDGRDDCNRGFIVRKGGYSFTKLAIRRMLAETRNGKLWFRGGHQKRGWYRFRYSVDKLEIGCQTFDAAAIRILRGWALRDKWGN